MSFKRVLASVLVVVLLAFLTLWFVNFGTFVHEYMGHGLVAKALGCEASPDTEIFGGVTNYECQTAWPGVNILIGLSSIIIVFLLALAIWLWAGEDNVLRVLAVTMMFYSCIPSAFPLLTGSDSWFVIQHGFPTVLAWMLWLLFTGVFAYLLVAEITEKNIFKKYTG